MTLRHLGRVAVGLVAALAALCVAAGPAAAADSIFWTNNSGASIGSVGLDGSGATSFSTLEGHASRPVGTALDPATGKIYWLDKDDSELHESNLDGTDATTIYVGHAIENPSGLAIDPAAGRIYWIESFGQTVFYADLDGSDEGTLNVTDAPTANMLGLAVDPAAGRVYWGAYGTNEIGWADLDGGGGGALETGVEIEGVTGLAIDPVNDRVYWTDGSQDAIYSAGLGGADMTALDTTGATVANPKGLAIDPEVGRVYWTNQGPTGESIGSAAIAGGGADLSVPGAVLAEPSYPSLLERPKPDAPAVTTPVPAKVGEALACGTVGWEPDLVASYLFRTPRTVATGWTRDGQPIAGAEGATFTPTEPGTYACRVTATNYAGPTAVDSALYSIPAPPASGAGPTPGLAEATKAGPTRSAPPAATLRLTKVRFQKRAGTATVLVTVSGPGRLIVGGAEVVGRAAEVSGAGVVKLKVAAKGAAAKALRRSGRARVRLDLRFAAAEGAEASLRKTIALHRTVTRHRAR